MWQGVNIDNATVNRRVVHTQTAGASRLEGYRSEVHRTYCCRHDLGTAFNYLELHIQATLLELDSYPPESVVMMQRNGNTGYSFLSNAKNSRSVSICLSQMPVSSLIVYHIGYHPSRSQGKPSIRPCHLRDDISPLFKTRQTNMSSLQKFLYHTHEV